MKSVRMINDREMQSMLGLPDLLPLATEFANAAKSEEGITARRMAKKNKAFTVDTWWDTAFLACAVGLVVRDGYVDVRDKSDFSVQEARYRQAPKALRKIIRVLARGAATEQKLYKACGLERAEFDRLLTLGRLQGGVWCKEQNGITLYDLPPNVKDYVCSP